MGIRFRKSIKMGPVRVNLSKSGVGYSVGGKGLRVTKKAGGGTRTTVSVPGTGLSYSKDSSRKKSPAKKKSSSAVKSSSNSTSVNQTVNLDRKGCLMPFVQMAALFFAIWLFYNYWRVILTLALLGVAGLIAFMIYRKKHPKNETEEPEQTEMPAPTEVVAVPDEEPLEPEVLP